MRPAPILAAIAVVGSVSVLEALPGCPEAAQARGAGRQAIAVHHGARLRDRRSRALERTIALALDAPVKLVARLSHEGVRYGVVRGNARALWLGGRPDRSALRAAVARCRADEDPDDALHGVPSCADRVLFDARRHELAAEFVRDCRRRNGVSADGPVAATTEAPVGGEATSEREASDDTLASSCLDEFDSTALFDVDAWQDALVVVRLTDLPGHAGTHVEPLSNAAPIELGALLDLRVVDLDGRDAPELVVDRIVPRLDGMRGIRESDTHVLTVLRIARDRVETVLSEPLAEHGVDLGPAPYDARCRAAVESSPPSSLAVRCCVLPAPVDEDFEDEPDEAPASGPDVAPWPAMPDAAACLVTLPDRFLGLASGHFAVCSTMLAAETELRLSVGPGTDEPTTLEADEPVWRVHPGSPTDARVEVVALTDRGPARGAVAADRLVTRCHDSMTGAPLDGPPP